MLKNLKIILARFIRSEDGSAIILALIIIAGLVGTGMGASVLSTSNTRQTTEYEDALKAFYSAEAGVEGALLEWRFNHDLEFWDQNQANLCVAGNAEACDKAKVKKAVRLGKADTETANPIPLPTNYYNNEEGLTAQGKEALRNEPWYELKMYYRDPEHQILGNVNPTYNDGTQGVFIGKDQTYEIKFPTDQGSELVTQLDLKFEPADSNSSNCRIMVVPLGADGKLIEAGKGYLNPDRYYTADRMQTYNILYNPGIASVRVKALVENVDENTLQDPSKNKTIGIRLSGYANSGSVHMPRSMVTIEAIGHYNDAERKLRYQIDRQSGTIMDIFDFGVFSKKDLKK